ncbi:fungal-specific transcription factor domain-containing protein [Xylogone sp. PMI_703]|nr:fungal-specific transcription factor domain-containing protein [Xylogone sp. PMI_703]
METQVTSPPSNTPTPAQSGRRAPKSRSGCLRCKAKRLKCDETKPSCYQCSRKQVTCPGYASKPLVWSTKYEMMLESGGMKSPELPQEAVGLAKKLERSIAMGRVEKKKEKVREKDKNQCNRRPNLPFLSPATPTSSTTSASPPSYLADTNLTALRPHASQSSVPSSLLHVPTILVSHYFSSICKIFSSFDGTLNPFRATVGRLWDGSAPIYYAIQSMAAASLANDFPQMNSIGVQMQRETFRSLYSGSLDGMGTNMCERAEDLDKMLLTVLLVGQTTGWHDAGDLGLVHLRTAKRLNQRRLEIQAATGTGAVGSRVRRSNQFFEQCIIYWDMLAGFVDDMDDFDPPPSAFDLDHLNDVDNNEKVFPHPWTGVAPRVAKLFREVGRLIRKYRRITLHDASSLTFLSMELGLDINIPQDSLAAIEATARAQDLEEELLAFNPPGIDTLVDAGDENTPVQHYILLAETYRCAALLEIYRVFPSILMKRVPSTASVAAAASTSPGEFLVSLALHIISLLESIPSRSGTRCLQPLVLIAAGSELRFSSPAAPQPAPSTDPFFAAPSISIPTLTPQDVSIATARRFVVRRFQDFATMMPAKPILRAEMLVKETWSRADSGVDGVFWMDVMGGMGLEGIFG